MELEILKYKIMSDQIATNIKLSKKQNEAYSLMSSGKNVFITGPGGSGKCLGKDTPVIMYNGEIKMIQNIKKGEQSYGRRFNSTKCVIYNIWKRCDVYCKYIKR